MNTFFQQFKTYVSVTIGENNEEFGNAINDATDIDELAAIVGSELDLDNQEAINYLFSLI